VSTPVVRRGDCPEALLAGRIPDLELDGLGVKLDCLDLEVDANGRDVRLGVSVIGKAKKKAGLADAGIADEEELEQVIAEERAVSRRKEERAKLEQWGVKNEGA
jgi:hypothetical protein